MARCKTDSCGAVIDWATRHDNPATHLPIDRESSPDGQYAVWRDSGKLWYRPLKPGGELKPGEWRAVSHYTTCTRPQDHSKKNRRGEGQREA